MSPEANSNASAALEILARLYAPIQDQLAEVDTMYRAALSSDDEYISNLLEYIEGYSGKKLRPALLLLAGRACGELTRDHIILGTVSEMLHTATLVHDDILDEALLRRKRQSINALAGNEVSVLLGDHIFSHAFEISLNCTTAYGAREFSRAMAKTCFGEIMQVHNRNNFELTESDYFRIIEGKTAELYATSAMIGAHYSGANEQTAKAMYDYGMSLGKAFQIMDDLLDLRGSEDLVGKTLGSDIEKGKPTLPLIHHLENVDPDARDEALALAKSGGREALATRLVQTGSFDFAQAKADSLIADAKDGLEVLKNDEMKALLHDVADFVLSREL
ncbi:MAG: polyprenyl synthetase family protein [Planctomycetota bacterium]|jgi:octaprenyl-diphosphate synthase